MDPKESRKYTVPNPPIDREAERRPSLLGRLFRRSSSTDEGAIQGVSRQGSLSGMGTSFDESGQPKPPTSITSAVKDQFVNKPGVDPEFNIFT